MLPPERKTKIGNFYFLKTKQKSHLYWKQLGCLKSEPLTVWSVAKTPPI